MDRPALQPRTRRDQRVTDRFGWTTPEWRALRALRTPVGIQRALEAMLPDSWRRRAEADEQLRPALAFYRGLGATRYVREGEALLAASA